MSWSVTLSPSVNPYPCWCLPPYMIPTLSWAFRFIRTAKVPQKLLCEQALCFHYFAVVQNLVAPPTKIPNLLQAVRIRAELTCTLSTIVMKVERDLKQMPKRITKRRNWKGRSLWDIALFPSYCKVEWLIIEQGCWFFIVSYGLCWHFPRGQISVKLIIDFSLFRGILCQLITSLSSCKCNWW